MPIDRLYQGTEPIAHPITGELIALDDREALFKAWTDGENQIRSTSATLREFIHNNEKVVAARRQQMGEIRRACDRIVYALAGQDVTRTAAKEWARDQIDQGC